MICPWLSSLDGLNSVRSCFWQLFRRRRIGSTMVRITKDQRAVPGPMFQDDAMKTLVGVDLGGNYRSAFQLAVDLGFPAQRFLFVHVVEPIPAYAPLMEGGGHVVANWMAHLREAGRRVVAQAEDLARAQGIDSASLV